MTPKRPPNDGMTLRELGIADVDCAFDPDGLLEGPPLTDASDLTEDDTDELPPTRDIDDH